MRLSSKTYLMMIAVVLLGYSHPLYAQGDVPVASKDEPVASEHSLAKAGSYLDEVALDWTRKKQCGTCHTNYAYLWSRPSLADGGRSAAMEEIRGFFEKRVANWDAADNASKPRWDAEVIATGVTLALNDSSTSGKLHASTRAALDRMWTLQQPDGGFLWLKCDWPPYEHDDYFGAVFAALGAGIAPDGYAKTAKAQAGLARRRGYLQKNPAPDLHHKAFLLWASVRTEGLMSSEERTDLRKQLISLQRPDGGWSLPSLGDWKRRDQSENAKDSPSDGYATGLIVYILRLTGSSPTDPEIAQGVKWLKSHQRTSGRWFTRSLNNDKAHYIANAGTGFAVMALKACGVNE